MLKETAEEQFPRAGWLMLVPDYMAHGHILWKRKLRFR